MVTTVQIVTTIKGLEKINQPLYGLRRVVKNNAQRRILPSKRTTVQGIEVHPNLIEEAEGEDEEKTGEVILTGIEETILRKKKSIEKKMLAVLEK